MDLARQSVDGRAVSDSFCRHRNDDNDAKSKHSGAKFQPEHRDRQPKLLSRHLGLGYCHDFPLKRLNSVGFTSLCLASPPKPCRSA